MHWPTVAASLFLACEGIHTKLQPHKPNVLPATQDKIFVVAPFINNVELLLAQAKFSNRIRIGTLSSCKIVDSRVRRCKRIPVNLHHIGDSYLRTMIVKHKYQGEPYILFLGLGLKPVKNWDVILLESLTLAHQQGAHLITEFPSTDEEKSGHNKPTFPIVNVATSDKSLVPCVKPTALTRTGYVHPSLLINASCVFGTAYVLLQELQALQYPVPTLNFHEDNFILSILCFAQGAFAMSPIGKVFETDLEVYENTSHKKHDSKTRAYVTKLLQCLTQTKHIQFEPDTFPALLGYLQRFPATWSFMHWLGVDFAQKQYAGRALLGLCPHFSNVEILHKYGSQSKFRKAAMSVCY